MTYSTLLLPQAELTEIRNAVEEGVMPQTCNIISRTLSNTKGSQVITEATAYEDVACRIYADQRENSRSYNAGNVMSTMTEWIATLPWDQVIYNGWFIEHEDETYEVVGVYDNPSFKVATRVDMVRLHVTDPL